ncbi:hypothetical protein BWQ93_16885 [Sphingopyxis sp. QXT-31]|uniref:hypothetical protein n=1 Tax=Sphingopyxis sp. QXT-31 TaxID=1357916 RepID=UPI00097925D7|nr:hypothetical protein [Sphingopyxis sp. QXT-31]APZ99971.1 hypothetical protein BWQ93_16885 [Sphingopyxis sp. QXT-31]
MLTAEASRAVFALYLFAGAMHYGGDLGISRAMAASLAFAAPLSAIAILWCRRSYDAALLVTRR